MKTTLQEQVEDEQQQCKYRHCHHVIVAQRGHRKREYCDDLCKQAEYRARKEDREHAAEMARQQAQEAQELAHIRATHGAEVGLDENTYRFLWQVWKRSGVTLTRQISDVIVSEVQRHRQLVKHEMDTMRQEVAQTAQEIDSPDTIIREIQRTEKNEL